MKYEVIEIGGDPEYDEPGFIVFRPKGQRQYQFEEVMGSYVPAQNDLMLEEILMDILPSFAKYAKTFRLNAPVIAFAELSDKSHVALFVDGTESESPVFLLDPEPTRNFTGYRLQEFVVQSLKHELGHAYLRTRGVEYEDEEEDVVEDFALTGDRSALEAYAVEAYIEED